MAHSDSNGFMPVSKSTDRLGGLTDASLPASTGRGEVLSANDVDLTKDPEVAKMLRRKPVGGVRENPFSDIARAMQKFQVWLNELRSNGMATCSAERVISVHEAATSRQLCIGVVASRVFLGVQETESSWFQGLPWLHVAVKRDSPSLNFVSEATVADGHSLPAFAVCFAVDSVDNINRLAKHHFLDVRKIEVDDDGVVIGVHSSCIRTIDVVLIEDDRSLIGLMAGRETQEFRTRSRFSRVMK